VPQVVRPQRPTRITSLATVLTGALCGLVLGVAVDAAVWLWVFGQALSGEVGIEVPLVVSTSAEGGDVVAQTGVGVLALPMVLALCGVGAGLLVAHRRHQRSGTTAGA
jgi:hypothetical protein